MIGGGRAARPSMRPVTSLSRRSRCAMQLVIRNGRLHPKGDVPDGLVDLLIDEGASSP